uniref:Uncharacterized protein n=2 Tax=environmental samples TaxID=68359 RepID=A0A075GA88_9EURY|nr:hypothetical protein [uncultured marine group II/III euryarchaeote KM3_13_G12]
MFGMSEKEFTPGGEDWEEQLLEQLSKMFNDMGMPMDTETIRGMMDQIRGQFEEMGIDPEKMAGEKIELNLEATMNDLAKMMGGKFPQKKPVSIEVDTSEETKSDSEELIPVNEEDIFIDGDRMILTLDCSRIDEIDDDGEGVEIVLTNDNSVVSVMVEGRPRPVRKYNIGRVVEGMDEWTINNGILDMTLII